MVRLYNRKTAEDPKKSWSQNNMNGAVTAVSNENMTFREAATEIEQKSSKMTTRSSTSNFKIQTNRKLHFIIKILAC